MQFVEGSRETHRKVPGAFRCTHKLAWHACIWAGLGWAGLGMHHGGRHQVVASPRSTARTYQARPINSRDPSAHQQAAVVAQLVVDPTS